MLGTPHLLSNSYTSAAKSTSLTAVSSRRLCASIMQQESQPVGVEENPDEVLSMDLVAVSNLPDQQLATSSAQCRSARCSKLITVRLDSLHLSSLSASVLQQLPACRSLHLQHNCLTSCSTLTVLPRLTFLAMAHNQLQQVEGLQELSNLLFLDISQNMIQQLDARHLPGSIKYLKVAGNPCCCQQGFAQQLVQGLPRLRELDGHDMSNNIAPTLRGPAAAATSSECAAGFDLDAGSASSSGTSDAEDPGDESYISRHLAGLQHLEQGCRSRQLASANKLTSSCSFSTRHVGAPIADCGASDHDEPALQSESSCNWVADLRCSQQLASRMIKISSSGSSASDMQETSQTELTRRSDGDQTGPSLTPAAILRQSMSLPGCRHSSSSSRSTSSSGSSSCINSVARTPTRSRSAAGQVYGRPLQDSRSRSSSGTGSAACANINSSNSSSSMLGSSQRARAPKLLSRPQSIGGYLPARPRLCPAASNAATAVDAGSSGCTSAALPRQVLSADNTAASASAATAAAKQASSGRKPALLMQQQRDTAVVGQAKPGAQLASSTISKPKVNSNGRAGRQVASAKCVTSGEAGSTSTTHGSTNSSKTNSKVSSERMAPADSSSQPGRAQPHAAIMTGSTAAITRTRKNAAGCRIAATQAAGAPKVPAGAAAAATGRLGQQRGGTAPRRLPSIPRATGASAATAASSATHDTSIGPQQHGQPDVVQHKAGDCCSARPASAGLRLAPVQHPALTAAYEHRSSSSSSRSSSRPSTSTSSGSADTMHASRATSSGGSQRGVAAHELSAVSEAAQLASSDAVVSADSTAAHDALAGDRGQLLQGCVAALGSTTAAVAGDVEALNAVAATACLAISSTAATMQQRSKQRTADARQQQVQEQLEQRQQLKHGIKQLKEKGLQLLRAGLAVSAGNSRTRQSAAAGLHKPGFLQALSADSVAAEVASRAERLRARLDAASLQVQAATVAPNAAGPDVPAAACFVSRGSKGGEDVEHCAEFLSSDAASFCSDDDEATSVQEQVNCSQAGLLYEQAANSAAADAETAAAGGDSMDSDLESLVAGVFTASTMPDWTSACHVAPAEKTCDNSNSSSTESAEKIFSSDSSTESADSEGVDVDFSSMFKTSLPPGV